jgi:hypothetical protein
MGSTVAVKLETLGYTLTPDDECIREARILVQWDHREDGKTNPIRVLPSDVQDVAAAGEKSVRRFSLEMLQGCTLQEQADRIASTPTADLEAAVLACLLIAEEGF